MRHPCLRPAALALLALAGCSGTGASSPRGELLAAPTTVATLTAPQIDAMAAGYGLQDLATPALNDVEVVQLEYRTPGVQPGEWTNASGALLIPRGAGVTAPLPLVVYARATTLDRNHTVADPSAPETRLLLIFYASQGYAVVSSDYLGYARSAYPYAPYVHADSEASAVIDAVRAARLAAPGLALPLDGRLMITGYSQGGHAAMATLRAMERDHAGEFDVVAAAPGAGPYSVSVGILNGIGNAMLGVQTFLPYEITAWQKVYGDVYARPGDVFKAPYDATIEALFPSPDVAGLPALLPGGTAEEARDALYQPAFLADLATNPHNGVIVAARRQDLVAGWHPVAPVQLCGSSGDPVVDFRVAQAAYVNFRSLGSTVTLLDVDPLVRERYAALLASNPAAYEAGYHGAMESPFCCLAAKAFFDQHR